MRALAYDATYCQSKHIKMSVFHQQKSDLIVEGRETNSSSSSLAEVFAFLKLLVKLVSSSILKYQINPFLQQKPTKRVMLIFYAYPLP